MNEVTRILSAMEAGEPHAANQLRLTREKASYRARQSVSWPVRGTSSASLAVGFEEAE
jgi:hypothetical protein